MLEAEKRQEQGLSADESPLNEAKEQRSFADTEARMMLMKRGEYDYGDNAQAVVDGASGVIVAAELTNVAADGGHLPDLVAEAWALREAVGLEATEPTPVSADAGHFRGDNAAEDGAGLDLLIAAGRDDPAGPPSKDGVYAADRFGYDPERDVWICPADKLLVLPARQPGVRGRPPKHRYQADAADGGTCPPRARCLKPGEERRTLEARDRRATGAMRSKPRQPAARRRYAQRKTIVEPVFGQMKENRGYPGVSLRGLALATGDYLLACLAHNLGKLLRVWAGPSRAAAVAA